MRTRLVPLTGLDVAAAFYALAYLAWFTASHLGARLPDFGSVAFYPLGLAVAWANWRNARAPGLDRRTRAAWRMLAGAAAVLWATGSAWTLSLTWPRAHAYPAWIDRMVYAQYGLTIAGCLLFPGRRLSGASRTRFRFDAALVVAAGFIIAYYFSLRLLVLDPTQSAAESVVDAGLDWALFAVAGIGFLGKRDPEIRRAMLLQLGANLAYLVGNSVLLVAPAYHAGDPADLCWFCAWAFRWLAARHAACCPTSAAGAAVPAEDGRAYRSGWFSYLMAGGALVLLLARVMAGDLAYLGPVAVAAMLMGALLVLRQFVEIEDNRRLFREQVDVESRFRSLVQNWSDVLLVVDRRGSLSYVSPSVERVFGGDARIGIGTPFRRLLPAEHSALAAGVAAGDPGTARQFETRLKVSPRRWREVEVAWTDLRADPAVGGIVVNCRDLTDRREYERYLRRARELDAVGYLAGGFAHDLNNLLMVIRGYAELLRSEYPDTSPLSADLDQVLVAVDRAASLTRKILAFSGQQPVRRKRLDLNAVIVDARPMLEHVARNPVQILLRMDPSLWPVSADQGQMEQVLVNLVSNASDAMAGGGAVLITTANRAVAPAAAGPDGVSPGDYVQLSVEDLGAGMSPEVKERVFEPFFSTKPAGQGLGLGLAIVDGIVADMDGHVRVESQPGRGSTFTILLPRAGTE